MSKAKKKVKRMKTWKGFCVVNSDGFFRTEVVYPREYLVGSLRSGDRIARVEVREIVTKRSNG